MIRTTSKGVYWSACERLVHSVKPLTSNEIAGIDRRRFDGVSHALTRDQQVALARLNREMNIALRSRVAKDQGDG
jgi:hypothetical protein